MSPFFQRIAFFRPSKSESHAESPIRRYRAEAALNGPVTDRRASEETFKFKTSKAKLST